MLDKRILAGTANVNGRRKIFIRVCLLLSDGIIYTHIIAYNASQVADVVGGIAVSWVANQDKSSFVVVTIIVLNESVGAIKIGVEPLAIPRRFVVGDFIELNGCVVTTPRPDASGSLA